MLKLSEKEREIMTVLWTSDEPLTVSGITEKSHGLNQNTVAASIKKLLNKGYVEVADIVYSGTVLTRCYTHVISAQEYALQQLQGIKKSTLRFSILNFVDDYLSSNQDETILDELEELIRKKREEK